MLDYFGVLLLLQFARRTAGRRGLRDFGFEAGAELMIALSRYCNLVVGMAGTASFMLLRKGQLRLIDRWQLQFAIFGTRLSKFFCLLGCLLQVTLDMGRF